MTTVNSAQGTQKLKVIRFQDGQVAGSLQCSVALNFGATSLVIEDILPDVPVAYVLNPEEGVFLADEVQRLMRLAIGSWLSCVIRRERIVACSRSSLGADWEVKFQLSLEDGRDSELRVVVAAATPADQVEQCALAAVMQWIEQLDDRPLCDELFELMAELDLSHAPRLRNGIVLCHGQAT